MTTRRVGWPGPAPAAVVLDLDDTLYPQAAYLRGAARAVGRSAHAAGLDGQAIARALWLELAGGSDRGSTIDRALAVCGVSPAVLSQVLPDLVAAFIGYRPRSLPLYPGAATALAALRARFPVACLTDGNPTIQRAKLAATGLAGTLPVVITDEIDGRATRKPHPAGLQRAADLLGVPADRLVMIGDRPGKDVAVAAAVGARSIRVRTGEYAAAPDDPMATVVVPNLAAAAAVLLGTAD